MRQRLLVYSALLIGVFLGFGIAESSRRGPDPLPSIGAVAVVTEATTGLTFLARVDTGADSTSIHCPPDAIQIEGGSAEESENVGKTAVLTLTGRDGRQAQVTAQIEGHVGVRTADHTENRYLVRLRLEAAGVERDAQVTLNDRSSMRFKLLLGRDFLRDAFVVNVAEDNDEP